MPRPIRNLKREFQDKFRVSLEAALTFRSACQPEALRQQLATEYASQKELRKLQAALKNLQVIVANREKALGPRLESERAQGVTEESIGSGRAATGIRAGRKRKRRNASAKPRSKARP